MCMKLKLNPTLTEEALALHTSSSESLAHSIAQEQDARSANKLALALKGVASSKALVGVGAVAIAIGIGYTAYQKYNQAQEDLRTSTQESSKIFQEEKASIEDYSTKYKELHTALIEAKGDEEKTYEIKSQLLELQTELNNKFGDEYGKLNLVTDAYQDQTEAIKSYNKEIANSYLNENRTGIKQAKTKMEEKSGYGLTGASTILANSDYGDELSLIAKKHGLETYSDESNGFLQISIKANPQDAYDTINEFMTDVQNKAKELGDEHLFDDILDASQSSLNRAKDVIDEYGEQYHESLMAQIASDDKLSSEYKELTTAVNSYNEALLRSDDIYSDETVTKAISDIQKIKTEMSNSEDWQKFSSITDEIFDSIDTRFLDFNKKISNDSVLKRYVESLQDYQSNDILALSDSGSDDRFNHLAQSADYFGLTIQDLITYLQQLGYISDNVGGTIEENISKSKSEIIDMVNSMSDGFEILDKIYSDVKDGDTFDFSNLDSSKFQEAFSGLEEEYTDFIETISSTPNDLSACQNAFNRLTTAYITQNGILADVTEETANVTIAMLNNMGVVNAEELVTRQLSIANEELGETGKKVKDATEDEVVAFVEKQRIIERLQAKQAIMEETGRKATEITEAEINAYMQENSALYETEQALAVYELAKVTANGTTIDVSGDIQNLMSLVKATGNACSALSALNKLKNGAINYSIGGKEGYDYLVKQAEQEVKNALNSMGNVETQYNGANKSNKSSGGSGSSKDTWLEEYKEKLSILNDNLDNELIDEKEFYTKSEELLNQYLKDSPSHVEKYSKEIAEAEKNLHNAWNSSYEADKDNLSDGLSSGQIDQVEYYKQLTELVNEYYDELNCSPYGSYTKEVKACMKEVEDAHNDAYDYEADELQKLLDNNTITEKQYIDKMSLIWDKYYKGQVQYAKRASETKLALLQKEKSYLQSLANAVSTVTGQEIDKLQEKQGKIVKKYEKEIKALEKQKKAIDKKIDALDDEKELLKDQEDIIQKQIDKIKDEADEEDKLYKLEKARYDLDYLKNQKTEKTIVDNQVVYKTDTSAISDAQNTLNGAERDYKIFQLEKEKDVLEEQIEVIEKQQEQLNKETEIIDKQIERIQEKIDSTNEYYEEKIEKIQKIQNEWQKALDYEEQAMAISLLKEKYGANVIEEILNGNMQSLSNWKQEYINTLGAIDIALNNQISSATLAYGELAGVTVNMSEATRLANGDLTTLSGSAEQLGIDATALKDKIAETNDVMGNINSDGASSSFDNIGNSAKNAKNSISDIGTTTSNTANTMSGTQFKIDTSALQFSTELTNIKKLQDELKVLVDSVKTSSSTIGTTIDVNSSKIDEVVWHLQQVLSKIQEIQRAMDLLQEKFGLIAQLDLTTINMKFDTLGFSIQNLITNLGNMINLVTGGETSLQSAFQLQTDSAIENLRLEEAEMNEPLTEAFDNIIAKLTELEEAITTETAVALNSFKEHYDGIMGKVVPAINHEIDRMEKFNKSAGKSINKTITITYKTKGSAKAGAYGQNALSSSFATGTKGEIKEDQLALVNELGNEVLVRDGKAQLIEGGAQYIQLRKHDILFNHKQSEELLKRGKVTSGGGHGRQIGSFATGTLSDYQLKKLLEQDKKYKENGSIFQNHSFNGKDYSKIFDNINKRSVQMGSSLLNNHLNDVVEKTVETNINQNINVTIPNMNGYLAYDQFMQCLRQFQTDAMQYANRN